MAAHKAKATTPPVTGPPPPPFGTRWLHRPLGLVSPRAWIGLADLLKLNLRPVYESLAGLILMPLLTIALRNRSLPLLASRNTRTTTASSSNNNRVEWGSVSFVLGCCWTAACLAHGGPTLVRLLSKGTDILRTRSHTLPRAWEKQHEALQEARLIRTRKYDLYLALQEGDSSSSRRLIVFLPGARISHEAYAGPALALAQAGYDTLVVETEPFRMPSQSTGVTRKVLSKLVREVKDRHFGNQTVTWIGVGHSMGGLLWTQLVADNVVEDNSQQPSLEEPRMLPAIVLWGAAAFLNFMGDLSQHPHVQVCIVNGSQDGVIKMFQTEEALAIMQTRFCPSSTSRVVLEGGTHGGFCDSLNPSFLEAQDKTTLSSEAQQQLAVKKTLEFLERLDWQDDTRSSSFSPAQ